jgi:hypothetical protein
MKRPVASNGRTAVTEPVTTDQVLSYLTDVDYPADKDTLVAAAEQAGAPEGVIRSIRAIPPVEYRNKAEVAQSVRTDPGAGRSPGRAAGQARTDGPPGVAEHLREPR